MNQSIQGTASITHRQAGRTVTIVLTLLSVSLCSLEAQGATSVITTLAFLSVTGFAALDVAGVLPDSLSTRPHLWVLIVPVSLAINVLIGTVLAVAGPSFTSCWFWGVTTVLVGVAETAVYLRRRLA